MAAANLARRQYGILDHADLIGIGVSASSIGRWNETGHLHRLYRGVYALGHTALTANGRLLAAVKACGSGAALSHVSAAVHWNLIRSSSPTIHVTTPGRASPRGIRVHRVRSLHPDDVVLAERIPVTSIARTLLDLTDVVPLRRLIRAIEQAERLEIFDMHAVERLIARSNGRRTNTLRSAIAAVTGEPPRVNSDWERDLLDFCDDHDIPRPTLNVMVAGYQVDALKYADLQLAGYLVLPITRLDATAARRITLALGAG